MRRKLVQVSELAESEQLPVKFLEQILQALKEAGIVASERGKFGGYRLAKAGRKIFIGEVVRLIDGPLAPIGCVSQTAYEPCTCPDEAHCGLRMLMVDVRNAIADILDRYTLADVVEITMAQDAPRQRLASPFRPGAPTSRPRRACPPAWRGSKLSRKGRPCARLALLSLRGVLHHILGEYSI